MTPDLLPPSRTKSRLGGSAIQVPPWSLPSRTFFFQRRGGYIFNDVWGGVLGRNSQRRKTKVHIQTNSCRNKFLEQKTPVTVVQLPLLTRPISLVRIRSVDRSESPTVPPLTRLLPFSSGLTNLCSERKMSPGGWSTCNLPGGSHREYRLTPLS